MWGYVVPGHIIVTWFEVSPTVLSCDRIVHKHYCCVSTSIESDLCISLYIGTSFKITMIAN